MDSQRTLGWATCSIAKRSRTELGPTHAVTVVPFLDGLT